VDACEEREQPLNRAVHLHRRPLLDRNGPNSDLKISGAKGSSVFETLKGFR